LLPYKGGREGWPRQIWMICYIITWPNDMLYHHTGKWYVISFHSALAPECKINKC
jgi:hypothetical protein